MNDDAMRRILQLERRLQDVTQELEAIRNRRTPQAKSNFPVLLQPVATIAARALRMDGVTWNVFRGNARLYDLQIRGNILSTEAFVLSKVTGDSVDRVVPLLNLWDVPLAQDKFVVGFPMEGFFITSAPLMGLFRFTLNGSWSGGGAAADVLQMGGTDTGEDTTLQDPLSVFSTLTTDDPGLAFLYGDKYYSLQAPCPE